MGGEETLGGAGWILLRSGYFLEGYIMPKTKKKMKRKRKRVKILEARITLPLSCAQQKKTAWLRPQWELILFLSQFYSRDGKCPQCKLHRPQNNDVFKIGFMPI